MLSIIKWVGSKQSIVDQLFASKAIPPVNKFDFVIEPFAGSASISFYLGKPGELNDSCEPLITLLRNLKFHPDKLVYKTNLLIEAYNIHANNKELRDKQYYFVREKFNKRESSYLVTDTVGQSADFLFLITSCFRGLCRFNSKGAFNAPVGDKEVIQPVDLQHFLEKSRLLKHTTFHNMDYKDYFKHLYKAFQLKLLNPKRVWIYLDPPYYGKYDGYEHSTDDNLIMNLYGICKDLDNNGIRFTLSNSDDPYVRNLFSDFRIDTIQKYDRMSNKHDTEIVIYN